MSAERVAIRTTSGLQCDWPSAYRPAGPELAAAGGREEAEVALWPALALTLLNLGKV